MRNTLIHRLVLFFGLVLGVALLGWVLVPVFVSTDVVRSAIERSITEITGQQVSVGADTDITLFPTPTATLTNITIAARGRPADAAPIAALDIVELDISLGSLMTGTPRFSSVRLIRPVFNIDIDEAITLADQLPLDNVRQAVRIAAEQRDAERGQDSAQADVAAGPPPIIYPDWLEQTVGIVSITQGRVVLTSNDDEPEISVDMIDGTLDWPRLNMPLTFNGSMVVDQQPLTVSFMSAQPIEALAGEVARSTLSVTSPIANLNVSGDFGFASGFFAVGDISLDTPSVRNLLAWRGRTIQAGRSLGALTLSASMQARGQTMRLNNLEIDVDGNAGTGILEIARRDADAPMLLGTLDFATLDLRAFLAAFTNLPLNTQASDRIDISFMRQLQTDLRISAASATFDNVVMTGVGATAQTTADLALFDLGDATAFGGALQARLRFDRNPEAPTIEVNLSGQDINMAAAKEALSLPAILPVGQSNFNWTMSAVLNQWSDLLRHSRGKVSLRQVNGAIAGFGPDFLRSSNQKQFSQIQPAEAGTGFESFAMESQIIDGEIKVSDAIVGYSDTLGVALNGVVQLSSGSLALTARIDDGAVPPSQQRYFIGGGWEAPYVFSTLAAPLLPAAE